MTTTQVQARRGTAAQVAAMTPAQGEIVVDTTNNRMVVGDGSTAGGFAAAKLSEVAVPGGNIGAATATAPAFNNSSSRVITSAWFAQNYAGGFVNKFRNANFAVAQRGTGGTTNSATGVYTIDGWILGTDGTNSVNWAQPNGPIAGFAGTYLELFGSATTTVTFLKQRIKSSWAAQLYANSAAATIQFLIYNGTASPMTPTITIKHPATTDAWGGTLTTDVNAASMNTVPAGTVGVVGYTFVPAPGINNGMEITLNLGGINFSGIAIYIAYADIRLTAGVATGPNAGPPPVEVRPFAIEMLICQRYYQQYTGSGAVFRANAGQTSGTVFDWFQFMCPMRVAPTMSVGSPSYTNASGAAFGNINSLGAELSMTISASGGNAFIPWTATAEL